MATIDENAILEEALSAAQRHLRDAARELFLAQREITVSAHGTWGLLLDDWQESLHRDAEVIDIYISRLENADE